MPELLLEKLPTKGRKETDEFVDAIRAMVEQFRDSVTKVVFPTNTTAALDTYETITVEVQDTNSKKVIFGDNKIKRVKLRVKTSGTTATGISLRDPVTGTVTTGDTATNTQTLDLNRGTLDIEVKASGAGDVILQMVDVDSIGITMSDEVTIAVS